MHDGSTDGDAMIPEPQAIRFRGVKHPTDPKIYVMGFWPEMIRVSTEWLESGNIDASMMHLRCDAGTVALRVTVSNGWAEYEHCGDEGPSAILFRLKQGWQQIGRRKRLKNKPARSRTGEDQSQNLAPAARKH